MILTQIIPINASKEGGHKHCPLTALYNAPSQHSFRRTIELMAVSLRPVLQARRYYYHNLVIVTFPTVTPNQVILLTCRRTNPYAKQFAHSGYRQRCTERELNSPQLQGLHKMMYNIIQRYYYFVLKSIRPLSDTRTFRKWHSAGSYRPLPCSLFIMAFRLLSTVKFFSDEHKLLKRAKNALRLIIKLITKNKAINNN